MKLVYFNARGLAETSRLLLAVNNVDYEDFRYPLKIIDWATHNMVKDEFEADKKNDKLLGSLNKVPFLELDNGDVLPQSKSIERYLANEYNMMGGSSVEAAKIDSICECVRDFKDAYQTVRKLSDTEKEVGMKKWFNETLFNRLKLLNNVLCKDHSHFSVGDKLSLADVVLYSFITQFFDNKESALKSCEASPHLVKIIKHVSNLDGVKSWLNKRPETAF
jgi:glutathione S-transferase